MSDAPPSIDARLDLKVSVCGAPGAARSALVREIENSKALRRRPLDRRNGDTLSEGSAAADVLVLLVEMREGFGSAARRLAASARAAGVRHIVLALDHPEPATCDREAFDRASRAFAAFTGKFEFASALALPLSTSSGENVVTPSRHAGWYRWPDADRASRSSRRRRHCPRRNRPHAGHRAICRAYRLRVGAGGDPRPRVPAQARRPGAGGQRHRREVPPRYRQPAPRSRPHAGPWRHRRVHGRHAHPAGDRWPRRLPPRGTLHAVRPFHRRDRRRRHRGFRPPPRHEHPLATADCDERSCAPR